METYFRNIEDITIDDDFVESGSLWVITGDKLILVDDDRYVSTFLSSAFAKAEPRL